ncbi:N-acetyltransferase eco [Cydia fagiglandana]|uniref:N-acetyltransferase eco n=1 Tax=Cydia fagiglandana TaxID=1458189 RepID=UPI002FEE364C
MSAVTPRRSSRLPHNHTPKMSERKKGLFQSELEASRESLTKHRRLPVVNSESDSDDCDLGIMGTLDSSSGDEVDHSVPKTPERHWYGTRSSKLLKENHDLKSFIKSPFTLNKYHTRYSCPEKFTGSHSTPVTPHMQNHPGTPSSTHSCNSVHTTSSTSSKARKSLASLIADTESCSSSLKDLNFDTDSGTDTKENTPTKTLRRSNRNKMTPKLQSFKGVLLEQKKNVTPPNKNPVVSLTKMDLATNLSPTQMLKTPHTTEATMSPPKLSHRRSVVEIAESPETCESEISHKRLRNNSLTEYGPVSKYPKIDANSAPKARLSLFNSDKLKISAKSFYGNSSPDLNSSITNKISSSMETSITINRRLFSSHPHRRKKKSGQINMGVRHRIRKPKVLKNKMYAKGNRYMNKSDSAVLNNSTVSNVSANNQSMNNVSMTSQNSSQELDKDKADPFGKEKLTIEVLLSQWEEEDEPEPRPELPCFNSTVIEETSPIFQPVTAIPVSGQALPQDGAVIIELGSDKPVKPNEAVGTADVTMMELHKADHGDVPDGQFLPVDGGFILVQDNVPAVPQEELTDLDEIERELKMLDEQILMMTQTDTPVSVRAANSAGDTPPVVGTLTGVPKRKPKNLVSINKLKKNCSKSAMPPKKKCITAKEVVINVFNQVFKERGNVTEAALETSRYVNVKYTVVRTIIGEWMDGEEMVKRGESGVPEVDAKPDDATKLFPIFSNPNPGTCTPSSKGKSSKKSLLKDGSNQYVIDAGQKQFGATQCTECGVIYQIGDPQDEHDHLVHHNATDVLKFNGWKEECVVGRWDSARCIRVRGGEANWKRVATLLTRVVHAQLGYNAELPGDIHAYTAYLYIDKKQIAGCAIVQPKTRAFKLIPGDPDCCTVEDYPVKCGISRIWTHASFRRRGVASRLLDCARASFLYGAAVSKRDVAFSAPTAAGKALATKYCGTAQFYVYLD